MKFYASVERWRERVRRLRLETDPPEDFLLAWIQKESAGRASTRTKLDERGLFQVHPDEARALWFDAARPGVWKEKFDRLLRADTDAEKDHQVVAGLELVRRHRQAATGYLTKVGAIWTGVDLLRLTKMVHVLPSFARGMIEIHAKDKGPPRSWADVTAHVRAAADAKDARLDRFVRFDKNKPKTARGAAERFIKNAEETASAAEEPDAAKPAPPPVVTPEHADTLEKLLSLVHRIAAFLGLA